MLNLLDENQLSKKLIGNKKQYIHGSIDIACKKLWVGIVIRVVSTTARYNTTDDTMIVTDVTKKISMVCWDSI